MGTQFGNNLWAGPAPMSPLTRPKFHYDWHWFWNTGNGVLGNNNIHSVDICRWGPGVTGLGRTVISYGGRVGSNFCGQERKPLCQFPESGAEPQNLRLCNEVDPPKLIPVAKAWLPN